MTQQNAALVEESAAAAESLREQAGRLAGLVSAFNLGDGTHAVAVAAAPAPKAPEIKAATAAPRAPAVKTDKKPAAAPAKVNRKETTAAAAPLPQAPATTTAAGDDWESF
jgi:hypothetical protein